MVVVVASLCGGGGGGGGGSRLSGYNLIHISQPSKEKTSL